MTTDLKADGLGVQPLTPPVGRARPPVGCEETASSKRGWLPASSLALATVAEPALTAAAAVTVRTATRFSVS
ncbi:hypothetical protein ABH935_009954 [Catenulispora sp. GAS73]